MLTKLFCSLSIIILLVPSLGLSTDISIDESTLADESPPESQSNLRLDQISQYEILFYDLYFDIDAERGIFNSHQNITFRTLTSVSSLTFLIHSDITIAEVKILDDTNNTIPIQRWNTDYIDKIDAYFDMQFISTTVAISSPLQYLKLYKLNIEYSFNSNAIVDSVGTHMLQTVVSTDGIRGLGWPSGLIPIISQENRYASHHTITIRHPDNQLCMASGNKVSEVEDENYLIESFTSLRFKPTSPSFSCDNYQVSSKTKDNVTVEFYYFQNEDFPLELLDNLLDAVVLFKSVLGDTGDTHFQFGFVDVNDQQIGGTSRGNVIFMRPADLSKIVSNYKDKILFVANLYHEIAHNWNGFVLGDDWLTNKYFLWYQEGGANFLASWALDNVIGIDAGNVYRKNNLVRYDQFKGYSSKYNLRTIPYQLLSDLPDVAIAYEYAGEVWEQLSLKIGHEALFNGLSDFLNTYWINQNSTQPVIIEYLFNSFEQYTDVEVEQYMDQWGLNNPQIQLHIVGTRTQKKGDEYETKVTTEVKSEKDFEIFTSIEYSVGNDIKSLDIQFTSSGLYSILLTTTQKPSNFVIDPDYRVPRIGAYSEKDDTLINIILRGSILIILFALILLIYKKIKRLVRK